ncbi:MAG: hypothetical protein AB7H80_08980 [Candidatus Kapaibacterium sp.]
MKFYLMILTVIVAGITMMACDEIGELTGSDGDPILIRYLTFKYAEIPAEMSDSTAISLARNERQNSITASAVEHWFPTTDSIGFPGAQTPVNKVIVTPPGSSHSGGTRLLGGQDFDIHPPQSGIPSSIFIDALGVGSAGQSGSSGEWELRFNEDELVVSGSSVRGEFMEFTLDSFDSQTRYGTGRFAFIARNREDRTDTRRWIVFDGEFALQR